MRKLCLFGWIIIVSILLFPTDAVACCTSVLCPYCSTSSSDCVNCKNCPNGTCPSCNLAGCDCNTPCQCSTRSVSSCSTNACCSSGNPEAERAAARARFNEIDQNRNGKITRQEARAWLDKTTGKKWVGRVPDKGKATPDQIFKLQFNRMDTNHDGVITPGELDKSLR